MGLITQFIDRLFGVNKMNATSNLHFIPPPPFHLKNIPSYKPKLHWELHNGCRHVLETRVDS